MEWSHAKSLIDSHTEDHVLPQFVQEPVVSVSLVTFQHRQYIEQAIESIVSQKTSFPFEVIVGEDGSTDGTFEILLEYQKKHPDKIRILRSVPNLGQYTKTGRLNFLRNLSHCRGKYVALLEGDDYWTCDKKLQDQVDLLERKPDSFASWHDVEIVGNRAGEQIFKDFGEANEFTFEEHLGDQCACATGSMVFHRSVLPKDFEKWQLNAPWFDQFLIALCASLGPFARCRGVRSAYRTHEGGITQTKFWNSWEAMYRLLVYTNGMKQKFRPRGYAFYSEMENKYYEMLFVGAIKSCSKKSIGCLFSAAFKLGVIRSFLLMLKKTLRVVLKSDKKN